MHELDGGAICRTVKSIQIRNETIPFFSETIRYRKFWGSADTDPIQYQRSVFFLCVFFFLNVELLYVSVLTWSSIFCVLNTIYYSVSQLVGQKCWVRVTWGVVRFSFFFSSWSHAWEFTTTDFDVFIQCIKYLYKMNSFLVSHKNKNPQAFPKA